MRKILLILAVIVLNVNAQDVIVKKDGSTILSKVMEVNPGDIKYKKFSNPNGPTYTIVKADVMSVNYENGEKETFTEADNSATSAIPTTKTEVKSYETLLKDNVPLIKEFNSHDVIYKNTDTDKKASSMVCTIGVKDGSVIETPELKAIFSMKKRFINVKFWSGKEKVTRIGDITDDTHVSEDGFHLIMAVTLKNKTNKTVYIDLGTSFFVKSGEAIPYYTPSSTTTSSGSTSGAGVNMGAVTGALGVGGALGTLAGGVNVGGGSSSSTSTTTYSQRIVSIPPMATISLEPHEIGEEPEISYINYFKSKQMVKENKRYYEICFENLKRGEKVDIPQLKDVTPLSIHITYGLDEMMRQSQNMHIDFYWRQVLGIGGNVWKNIDFQKCPLIFTVSGNSINISR